MLHRSYCLAAVLLLIAPLPARPDPQIAAIRARFAAAFADARRGIEAMPAADEPGIRDYPLYPYLQAARLQRAVETGRDDIEEFVASFLAAHPDEPVSWTLRQAWLARLAAAGDWARYLEYYDAGSGDQSVACDALTARIRQGAGDDVQAAAIAAWLTPRSAPDSCDPVFDWLRTSGVLSAGLIEQRARLALEAGDTRLARWLSRSLPPRRAAPLTAWIELLDAPATAIDRWIARADSDIEPQALEAGWTRLARRDPDAAIARYDALVRRHPDPDVARSRYARPLALALAWNRRPEALDYFARIAPADFDESTHEWQVRAALWASDWSRVARAIEAMPDALRESTRWRYWSARASEQLGASDLARAGYESVIPTDNYYALQAAARLDRRYTPVLEPIALDAAAIDALADMPAFVRAGELLAVGEPQLADREWRFGYEPLAPAARVQAIGLAARWGWHFQSIATAATLEYYNDYPLLYPRPFDDAVRTAARLTGLPDPLIYAVIRQESLYQPYAVSSAGAVGLMQLLPSTAARTARALAMRRPSRSDLTEPLVNVKLGAATLNGLIDRFDSCTELALAGYNAGPAAARRWLPEQSLDADVWIENIPYNETRGYVQRVRWHQVVFAWLDEGKPQDVTGLLARIEGASGALAATQSSGK